jgi:HAD superfamily hydrolase (TIGR01549 family)
VHLDAVLFDVDDTLCRYRRSGEELLEIAFEQTGIEPFLTREEYHDRYPEFVDESDSIADLRERCFEAVAVEKGYEPGAGRRVAAAYAAARDHGNVEPLAGVETALESVSSLPLGVVTNGAPAMQTRKLEALGLADTFDVVVHAGYEAPAKPAPEPFETAVRELDVSRNRTLHVGNSLESDVAGANAAGVGAAWVPKTDDPAPGRPPEGPVPDHTLPSLSALPEIVSE